MIIGYENSKDNRVRTCPICNKKFFVSRRNEYDYNWGYSIKENNEDVKLFCSYSCMRKFEVPYLKRVNRKIQKQLNSNGPCEYTGPLAR